MFLTREVEQAEVNGAAYDYINEGAARFYVIDQLNILAEFYKVPVPVFSYFRKRNVHGSYSSAEQSISIPHFTTAIDSVLAHEFAHHLAFHGYIPVEESKQHTEKFYELVERVRTDMVNNGFVWENSPRQVQFGLVDA